MPAYWRTGCTRRYPLNAREKKRNEVESRAYVKGCLSRFIVFQYLFMDVCNFNSLPPSCWTSTSPEHTSTTQYAMLKCGCLENVFSEKETDGPIWRQKVCQILLTLLLGKIWIAMNLLHQVHRLRSKWQPARPNPFARSSRRFPGE